MAHENALLTVEVRRWEHHDATEATVMQMVEEHHALSKKT